MFELGNIIVSKKIADATQEKSFKNEVQHAYNRYRNRDWGNVKGYKNDLALINENDKILGVYETSKGTINIVTERDRSATTVLFAGEYVDDEI